MNNPKFQIYRGKDDKFYFRLIARNGENILASEGYGAKSGCQSGVESVKKRASHDEAYQKETAADGRFFFKLLAGNKQTIGMSQMYATRSGRDRGIEAVKGVAPDAPVEDAAAA